MCDFVELNKKLELLWEREIKLDPRLIKKYEHSKRVADYVVLLSGKIDYWFFGLVHDIGRIQQLKKINSFDDNTYNHVIGGIDYIEENEIDFLKDFILAKDVILYHSGYISCPTDKQSDVVYFVTLADKFDNALTCKDYLLYEEEIDNKGYKKAGSDSPNFSPFIIDSINNCNYNIDKRYCKTYLDYFYFAHTLLINALNNDELKRIVKNSKLSQEVVSSIEFFENLFSERILDSNLKEKVLLNLAKYKNNKE